MFLRHQLNILQRKSTKRAAFKSIDRLVFAGLYHLVPGVLDALKLKRETVIRWHRAGFRASWRWKSKSRGGRPKSPLEVRQLIRDMSIENPLWGASRIRGELLLGIDVGQTTVAKYMARESVRHPKDGDVSSKSRGRHRVDGFVRSPHDLVLAVVGFLVLRHSRREILWLGVTAHPNAQWIARQLSETYGWQQAPQYRSRSVLCLWQCLYPSRSRDGHSGPADRTTIAMAERTCGEAHRFDRTGLP